MAQLYPKGLGTHFSRLLLHTWAAVGIFFNPGHHTGWMIKYRRLKWAGHVARMEEGRSAFKMLTSKSTGKGALGMPRLKWKDIRIYL